MSASTSRRRRTTLAATLVWALAGLAAAPALAQGKVAMLLPGSINDQSWNAGGYAAMIKLKAKGEIGRAHV